MDGQYKMPERYWKLINKAFCQAMLGELISVFGLDYIERIIEEEKDGSDWFDLQTSTGGWNAAFGACCYKFGGHYIDMYLYCKDLDWSDYDLFNGLIEDKIINNCIKNESHKYYYNNLNYDKKITEAYYSSIGED